MIEDEIPQYFFVDINVKFRERTTRAAIVLRGLHAFFKENPRQYAIALPRYDKSTNLAKIRVFSQSHENSIKFVYWYQSQQNLIEHASIGRRDKVSRNFKGPWACFTRFRIPTIKAERKLDGNLRERRIKEAVDLKLPHFNIRSSSNGQRFELVVRRVEWNGVASERYFASDSYGLSTAQNICVVPVVK